MIYLFEPYNAYQKPAKKKHWTQIAEEEALLIKMQLEEAARLSQEQIQEQTRLEAIHQHAIDQHLALREAAAKQNQQATSVNNQNIALPQYFPQPAQQQVQDGQYAAPAGGGGWVSVLTEELQEAASFTTTPTSGIGPLAVTFANTTPTPDNDTFLWLFGSGSATSASINPSTPFTYTALGSYTITLQETSSAGNTSTATQVITVSPPTLTSAFVASPTSGHAPLTVAFTSNTVYNGTGTLTYLWNFGSGSLTSTAANPTVTYSGSGVYTVSLRVTESLYNVTSIGTRANYISAST